MKELTCIICPRGCRLRVYPEEGMRVEGFGCLRGEKYAQKELTHPERVLTSTVRAEGGAHARLPVKTDGAIPRERLFEAMHELNGVTARAPVARGEVLVKDFMGLGVNLVATRAMDSIENEALREGAKSAQTADSD